jgi:hypothetical protein
MDWFRASSFPSRLALRRSARERTRGVRASPRGAHRAMSRGVRWRAASSRSAPARRAPGANPTSIITSLARRRRSRRRTRERPRATRRIQRIRTHARERRRAIRDRIARDVADHTHVRAPLSDDRFGTTRRGLSVALAARRRTRRCVQSRLNARGRSRRWRAVHAVRGRRGELGVIKFKSFCPIRCRSSSCRRRRRDDARYGGEHE